MEPVSLRVSILIPCHRDHFPLLGNLLDCYAHQTVVPDEVVISLSESSQIPEDQMNALEERPWPFFVRLLRHRFAYPPGRNRNEACANSSGDLMICQDADDLPHPQRVEVLKFLFETYEIDHLLHQWTPSGEPFQEVGEQTEWTNACYVFRVYSGIDLEYVHNGSVAFLRALFDKLHWTPRPGINEDVQFNRGAYAFCRHKVVLGFPLIQYRGEFSTFDLNESIN